MTHEIDRSKLGPLTRLGIGGQGAVYETTDFGLPDSVQAVYKEYLPQVVGRVDFSVISAMADFVEALSPPDAHRLLTSAAWPARTVTDNGRYVGFVMPRISDEFRVAVTLPSGKTAKAEASLQHLLNPADFLRKLGTTISEADRFQLLRETAELLIWLHGHGIAVGDLSAKNILYSLTPYPRAFLIDCDSMSFRGRSAVEQLETPDWDVRAVSREPLGTAASDAYKFGLIALRLLVGDQGTRDPARLSGSVPADIVGLISRSLSPEPLGRAGLHEWIRPLAAAARTAAQTSSPASRAASSGTMASKVATAGGGGSISAPPPPVQRRPPTTTQTLQPATAAAPAHKPRWHPGIRMLLASVVLALALGAIGFKMVLLGNDHLAYTEVAAASDHTCGLKTNGVVTCWGDNNFGQSNAPAGTFSKITSGDEFSCAIDQSKAVQCWGIDEGQLDAPSGHYTDISAGAAHACAISEDSRVTCWGNASYADRPITSPDGTFKSISAGSAYTCGIKNDSTVACWDGRNDLVELNVPRGSFSHISSGETHACAIKSDGTPVCWGDDRFPQALKAPLVPLRNISSGFGLSCGLTLEDRVLCWGEGAAYAHALNDAPSGKFSGVSVGRDHACAINASKRVQCWGDNGISMVPPDGHFLSVSSGPNRACAVRTDGALVCWGFGSQDLDLPTGDFVSVHLTSFGSAACGLRRDASVECWGMFQQNPPIVASSPSGPFRSVSVGTHHACGIKIDASLYCWGNDSDGALSVPNGEFMFVSAGDDINCAIRTNGGATCWGSGTAPDVVDIRDISLTLGSNGCAVDIDGAAKCWSEDYFPGTVPDGSFKALDTSVNRVCGIKLNDTLACWGIDSSGQLIPPTGEFSTVSVGFGLSCGTRLDRTLVCWGASGGFGRATPPRD